MLTYVNYDAVRDSIKPIEAETDPIARIELSRQVIGQFHELITNQLRRTAFELKKNKAWNTGQIAEAMGISERLVKQMIAKWSDDTGEWNPLRRIGSATYTDISNLVGVRRERPQSMSSDS
jgi:hypothetical protein